MLLLRGTSDIVVIRKVLKAACGHRDLGLNLAKVLGHVLIVVIMMITNELIIKLKDRVIHIKLSCLLHVMGSALSAFV